MVDIQAIRGSTPPRSYNSTCKRLPIQTNNATEYVAVGRKTSGNHIQILSVPNRSEQQSSRAAANARKDLQKYSVVSLPRGIDESMSYDLDVIQPTNEAVWSAFAIRLLG